jgi:HEAT repeat protein/cyclophilin family peptidyl-prolyl cis-trans isomerase
VTRSTIALLAALGATACASAPPAPPPKPIGPSIETKTSWILRLEDQRALRDPAPPPPPPAPAPPPTAGRHKIPPPVVEPPPLTPDLVQLLGDGEARVRRRAALAIGRVGLREGVAGLTPALSDTDPEVRQMAAFALGLIGDRSARDPLVAALNDPSLLVKGSAAEALGLIGDAGAAPAVAQMAAQIVASGALAQLPDENAETARDTPAAAYRLALYALVRLKSYDALVTAALDGPEPRLHWWPVAYALQRFEDPRGVPALLTLLRDPQPYTRAFAAKGLGAMKDRRAVPALIPLAGGPDKNVAVEAIRALGRLGDRSAAPALIKVVEAPRPDQTLRLEAIVALGSLGGDAATATLLDVLGDPAPQVRAAAIRAVAQVDAEGFVTVLSGLDPDMHWSVRAALASVLGSMPPEAGLPRLKAMLEDTDQRVIPAVLASIAKLRAPDAAAVMKERLASPDPVIRAAAANAIGELKPADGAAALAEAYRRGERDTTYVGRAAALTALAGYGASSAVPVLTTALSDPDWAVRVKAATLLKQLDPASDADQRIRPAPSRPAEFYANPRLANPPVSTQAYIDTDRGTIQIEFAVLDAPLTVDNFVTLARKGFFDGVAVHRVVPDFVIQAGDPRGDGEGGPGYAIRDELNERPYLRGTVGMALDWADTGGSQFFITHSPQPHLDGKYTVFGRVIAGMEIVDQIQQWDVIRRVRIWDGSEPEPAPTAP